MVEEKAPPTKQGLHGWKAAAAVFGCGTLAAFGVFGVLVGGASLFLDFTSSGIAAETGGSGDLPAEHIGEPRSSLEEGEMNVCEDNLDYLSSINTTRQDGGEDYVDTASGAEPEIEDAERVVRDDCLWTIIPSSNSAPWHFRFSYEAVIDAERGGSAEEVAAIRYEEVRSELSSELANVESEGKTDLGEKSYSVYGTGDQGQSVYIALIQTRSAVYQIRFDDQVDTSVGTVSENEFRNEARKIADFLGHGFEYWIPE
ncbi:MULTISPECIES: hypothetical protein [Nocardiopsis]|uniref:DUF3558 domain-containing protein n=1 Tax=Nocardiopsis sinuspersici TaxID=501010 RepID=A0A1V3BVY8_9ACTN|nr:MULTISPECIES: hypothetical protein [Nocardiopsis]OOC52532.1 hypothetical protein NOSIN_00685 [Nocardiopsis sinuspersici]